MTLGSPVRSGREAVGGQSERAAQAAQPTVLTIGLLATAIYLAYLRWTWHRWRNEAERWRHRRPVPRLGRRQHLWRTEQRDASLP
ncbi:hypothetical protein V6U89_11670 [Micromonospora sp. CPCC 206171]|uniref:hypothetical protein n=1 Tax=Micromonospora sp. CPCC 206171 TaxID=3122405 RepID=UPI002FF0ED43